MNRDGKSKRRASDQTHHHSGDFAATLPGADRRSVNAVWLMRLRWAAVAGQLLTIGIVSIVFGIALPLAALIGIVALTAATNLAFALWLHRQIRQANLIATDRRRHLLMGILMATDLFSLTALLYFTGGMENPFSIFYFVNLALSAVILPTRWGWVLTAVAVVCMLFLASASLPLVELDDQTASSFRLGQLGQLVAFVACAIVLIHFITRVTRELQVRESALRHVERLRSRSDKLEALGTLAAGAGHELATPLSTIAVVANELTHHLQGIDVPETVPEDIALIRSEVDHCRTILDRMKGDVGQGIGERVDSISISDLAERVVSELRERDRVLISLKSTDRLQVLAPIQSLTQAIRGVIQNALDASTDEMRVELSAETDADMVCLTVRDTGPGMSPEVLKRAGEPFFTTKEPGKGMGLGLFLTRSVIERLGGRFDLKSSPNRGVTAVIQLPLHQESRPKGRS